MSSTAGAPAPNIDAGLERFWGELRVADPQALSREAGVSFRDGRYVVPFLGGEYEVDPESRVVAGPAADLLASDPEFRLLLLGYLVLSCSAGPPGPGAEAAPALPAVGDWVSERQLPGGSLFFQGPHALPLAPLLRRYAQDPPGFRRACLELGGSPLPFGDAGFAFRALPRVPLGILLWVADEEFPARAGMLFEPTVAQLLPLDLVLALARAAVLRLEALPSTS